MTIASFQLFDTYDLKALVFRCPLNGLAADVQTVDVNGNPMLIPQGFKPIAGHVSTSVNDPGNASATVGNVADPEAFMEPHTLGARLTGRIMRGIGIDTPVPGPAGAPVSFHRSADITVEGVVEIVLLGILKT